MFKKMIKWTLIAGVMAGTAGFLLFGEHCGSYFRTVGSTVRNSLRGKIPVEFEIKRAERLIQAIDPEVNECKREVAAAEVDLEHLNREIARLRAVIGKQEAKLKGGAGLLGDAKVSSLDLAGHKYSRRRIEMDLERTFEMFKNNKAILKAKEALVERQSMAVTASRVKLDSVRTRKAELENTIAALKVQKKHLDALAASHRRHDLDDSALSQATEVLAKVKKRLDVTQKMIEDDIYFAEGVTRSGSKDAPRRDIVKEIGAHFGKVTKPGLTVREPLAIDR
ncbi:MAG: hypothetical protein H6837_00735 [Planctomycetes bacterium]|nr:hypothetical protein [Planctomycetota bacterium]